MRRMALGFLLGSVALQQLATLPSPVWSLGLLVLVATAWRWPSLWLWASIGMGFLWANLVAHAYLAAPLEAALEGQDVVVEGVVASLPVIRSRSTRFQFSPLTLQLDGEPRPLPGTLLLTWYGDAPPLRVGERWRLQVRLKQPHGFMNPGGFDYEAWLFRQGIRAKGYVRQAPDITRRLGRDALDYPLEQWRQSMRDRLVPLLAGREQGGIVLALAMGLRDGISREQWQVLQRTGTSHLVAISGLHVGLVAGFAFFAMRRVWRLSARAALRWPATKAGAVAAMFAATGYALLAGLSIPTQRALVMVLVVMLATLLQRRTRPSSLLSLALLLVLVLDPMAVLAPGFWLSFAAVAIIFYGMQGRLGKASRWWRWGRVQCVVAIGLLPVTVLQFQQASLVAPLANLVAVPWVSMVTVPLTLLGTLLAGMLPEVARGLLGLANDSLSLLWWGLQWLSDWPSAVWRPGLVEPWTVVAAVGGVLWLLSPRGLPARWVGLVWLLPLVFARAPVVAEGEAVFTLLDVGQGLAAVVQTREHVLVFDTGPRFSSGFNTGDAVIAPFLRASGIGGVDVLVVSHGDNDHRGGVDGLARQIPILRTLSSVPERFPGLRAKPCHTGLAWEWNGVQFRFLNPGDGEVAGGRRGNNRSCVLRVQAGGQRVLLTGDIERGAERQLLARARENPDAALSAQVLVVPHHGSKTSSSEDFLRAVSPQLALFPVGYRNRYGFPKPEVVARYRAQGVQLLDSASSGAIEFRLRAAESTQRLATRVHRYRQQHRRYWYWQDPERFASSGASASLLK
ncbi:MAG: DNA internalization-related competence protein ComEC/Rec2 [Gammaproteobacteria bacterium]|nr:DNA internalization-related competence protein ComEC/Rec2 [Gammaproteobacteria bacterium]